MYPNTNRLVRSSGLAAGAGEGNLGLGGEQRKDKKETVERLGTMPGDIMDTLDMSPPTNGSDEHDKKQRGDERPPPILSFQVHQGLTTALMDQYDAFILDQYGVLHNGERPLDGVLECLQELAVRRGKPCIVLSNSPSSGASNLKRLQHLGFDTEAYFADRVITGGDQAIQYIRQHMQDKKALFLTYRLPKAPSPAEFLADCGNQMQVVDSVEEADFVLLHGVEVLRGPGPDGQARETSLGDFIHTGTIDHRDDCTTGSSLLGRLLTQCLQRNLPMLCCNPDLVAVAPDGSQSFMPGTIAQRYQEMGGACTSFGKPQVSHFEACLRALNVGHDHDGATATKRVVVHVGDSLHHDVAGANAAGIDSIFVTGGIHRQELPASDLGERAALEQLFSKYQQTPTHVIPWFRVSNN